MSSSSSASSLSDAATMERIRRRTALLPPPPSCAEHARMSGFLRMRQTAREWRMKTWYVVLFNAHVYWFAGKRDAQVAARLQGQAHVVGARESDGAGLMHVYAHAFEFTARNGRVFFCAAPSEDEQQRWIAALNTVLRHERVPSTGSLTVSSSSDSISSHSSSSLDGDKATASSHPLLTRPSLSSDADSLSFRRARSTGRLELSAKTPSDAACYACDAEFGSLRRRRHDCGSCGRSFCRWHCAKSIILDGGADIGTRLARVCDACALLQHFTTFARALTVAMMNRMNEPGGAASSIMCKHDCYRPEEEGARRSSSSSSSRSSSGSLGEPRCHRRQWEELRLVTSSHASFTALNLMCFLKKYQRKPWLFARAVSLFIPMFETDPEALAEYWVQFVGIFVPLIESVYPEKEYDHATMPSFASVSAAPTDYVHVTSEEQQSSLYLYMDITLAICRRSTSFALRTVWECLALYEDAQQRGNTVCLNYILLLIYLVSSFNGDSELVANIWLREAPDAQADALVCAMDDFLRVADAASRAAPRTLVSKWIHATREEEMWSWKQRVVGIMSKYAGEERVSSRRILALFSPVVAEGEALYESVISETSEEHATKTPTLPHSTTTRQERVFNSEANFVHNLTAIAERLRHVTPVSARPKMLPDLLLRLQATLGSGVSSLSNPQFLPLHGVGSSSLSRTPKILRVVLDEGKVFSTRCRAPTMIVFEALAPQPELPAMQESDEAADDSLLHSDTPAMLATTTTVKPPSRRKLGRQDSEMLDRMLCSFGKNDHASSDDDSPRVQSAVLSDGENGLASEEREREGAEDLENEPPPEVLSTEDARLVYEESTSATMLATMVVQASEGGARKNAETWEAKVKRIQAASDFGELPGWTLVSVIAKSFDDLRQEVFALQLMTTLQGIFEGNDLGHLYLRPYKILCTGANAGLIETLPDAFSIDAVKKQHGSLGQYFGSLFGSESSEAFHVARQAFVASMAASSVFCYLFQIKDRHNGNIMIDRLGHVMHIDFGFILGIMPGGAFSLEQDCPFKLTVEMVDVMGGLESKNYRTFREHFVGAMLAVRREYVKLLSLIHLTISDSPFPCFQVQAPGTVLDAFRRRLFLEHTDDVASALLLRLVDKSYNHWGMRQYDKFQRSTNGIVP